MNTLGKSINEIGSTMTCTIRNFQTTAETSAGTQYVGAATNLLSTWRGSDLVQVVFENFPGGIALIDAEHRVILCNTKLKSMLDYPDSLFSTPPGPTLEELFWFNARRGEYGEGDTGEQVGRRLALLEHRQPHLYERIRPNGTVLEVRGTPIADGGFVTTYFDVTEQRRDAATIAHMALHDGLTDLPNRSLLMQNLGIAVARADAENMLAVHYLDLDGFKNVNDSWGHQAGDSLLIDVAQRLQSSVRAEDFVARIGGDEFAIVQLNVWKRSDAMAVANRIITSLSRPFDLGRCSVQIGASIGIALAPWNGRTPDSLLISADDALYRSKKSGRGRFSFGD